jgi:molybdopterin converting factor small subunit
LEYDCEKAVQVAFPNINLDHFYYETYNNTTSTFVNIGRKEGIDELLESYNKNGISIVGFSLGNLIAGAITKYVSESVIYSSNAKITLSDNRIQDISRTTPDYSEKYDVNGITLNPHSINPFSGVLSYLTSTKKRDNNFENITAGLRRNFEQQKVFEVGLKSGLGFIFIALLINFLVFSHYQEKVNKSSSELANYHQVGQTLEELEKEVEMKRIVYDEINSSGNGRVSFYMDKIANSIPESIMLQQIAFQPFNKSIREDKELEFDLDSILISGESSEGEDYSKWIVNLESFEWIDNVLVQEYGLKKGVKNKFQITLTLNHAH